MAILGQFSPARELLLEPAKRQGMDQQSRKQRANAKKSGNWEEPRKGAKGATKERASRSHIFTDIFTDRARFSGITPPPWKKLEAVLILAVDALASKCMRTTLDIAEDVLHAAREIAAHKGSSAGKVLSDLARQALQAGGPKKAGTRNGIPEFAATGEPITLEKTQQLADQEAV